MLSFITDLLIDYGVKRSLAGYLSVGIVILAILIICIITNLIVKKVLLRLLVHYIKNNKFQWDDIMLRRRVFHRIAGILPAIIVYAFAPVFGAYEDIIRRIVITYFFIIFSFIVSSVIDSIDDIYRTYPISKVRPIKGLLQVVKIAVYIISGIIIIANLMGESPLILLSGIGALAAVFSFVFKDSILGFIAGIQLTSNDMLRIGDWIEMNKYGADGDVIDITLNTVKVQNFDKTIVSIPAYALVSDSFKNWRGMTEFGGRRLKRAINIDVNSIKFCTKEMIEYYKKIDLLADYISQKETEIQQYNKEHNVNTELSINGRHLTNIGVFRIYMQNYLANNPKINNEMTQMVRQLQPSETGIPLEIYVFTKDTSWDVFERVQADIFDHIFAVIDKFELRIFQNPTGYDMKQMRNTTTRAK